MYDYFKGQLTSLGSDLATLEVGGVGYLFHVPSTLMAKATLGEELKLYASFVVREQSQQLFGFTSKGERDLFELLLTISGIGPKTSLNIIGYLTPEKLSLAIASQDVASLCLVPGIGKKTAERLIVEMKGKSFAFEKGVGVRGEAMQALLTLGMSRSAAQIALEKASQVVTSSDLSALIAAALTLRS